MSTNLPLNHLIMKRVNTTNTKNRDISFKNKKADHQSYQNNMEGINLNLSVDVRSHVMKQKQYPIRSRPNNTINLEIDNQKAKRKNKLLFFSSKRQYESSNQKSVKLAYGNSSPKAIKQRINIYTSQKTIKEKSKRFSLSTNIRGESELLQNPPFTDSSPYHNAKQHQTVNMQKHMIITKYQKVKQLLKDQKYSQAGIYLKQIIPYIQQKSKKKELYFWLIASLMKSNSQNRHETTQNYIVQCLQQFPNFYDIYLYWGKIKLLQQEKQDAIQIYEKAISINNRNSQAYSQLSNIYLKDNNSKQAFKILLEGFNNSLNSVSIPIKIIQNYKLFGIPLNKQIEKYLARIESNCTKKSTQYMYALGYVDKQRNNLNEALISFLQSIQYNSNKGLATKSLQYLIKIHVSKKDFYAACYDLKRAKYLNIDVKKIQRYEVFLQGVNFVMKKRNQQGIKLLTKIKDISTKVTSKKRITTYAQSNPDQNKISFSDDPQILSLTIKYLAYAHFKLGNHKQAIKCYKMLQKIDKQLDKTSKYNMLLAEGIVLADFHQDFQNSIAKFQQAKIYLFKIQPWIYQAIVNIQKQVHKQRNNIKLRFNASVEAEQKLNSSVLQALNIMQQGFQVNTSSSNLLYHRTILHLYFSSLKAAMQDINVCIQKAQQNLPKYFYLRGICFACTKNLKKAINEFSISISLSKQYSVAYLQRAKCYFLSGQTEMGFQDLKIYMDQCPNDVQVHKWIGDLLFEGTSYTDSIKAYNEMGNKISIQALCMRIKAQLRVCSIKQINQTMNQINNHQHFDEQIFSIDIAAYNLFSILMNTNNNDKQKYNKQLQKRIKQLNNYLQGDDIEKGQIFNLVDCMNLIGIGHFYTQKYIQSYESFLLVLQFLKSTKNKLTNRKQIQTQQNSQEQQVVHKQKLNTEFQQQNFDLKQEDVYLNMFICLLSFKDYQSLLKLAHQEMISIISSKTQRKVIDRIITFVTQYKNSNDKKQTIDKPPKSQNHSISLLSQDKSKNSSKTKPKKQATSLIIQPRIQNSLNSNMKKTQISLTFQKASLTVKTSLIWSSYHGSNDNLSFSNMAKKLINDLHAGYIDNMPQGPWIRRNEFGVLFTDNILDQGNESSFITTNRQEQQQQNYEKEYEQYRDEQEYQQDQEGERGDYRKHKNKEMDTIQDRKKAFLKQMKLDLRVQNKLNKIMKKE